MNKQEIEAKAKSEYSYEYGDHMYFNGDVTDEKRDAFIEGALWMQQNIEEEYSDEALEEFADAVGEEIALASDASSEVERLRKERDELLAGIKKHLAYPNAISAILHPEIYSLIQKIEAK